MAIAAWPSLVICSIVRSSSAPLRSSPTMLAPFRAARMAVAAPMPVAAPLMNNVWPRKRPAMQWAGSVGAMSTMGMGAEEAGGDGGMKALQTRGRLERSISLNLLSF
jgi:hypothetical protein